MDAHFVDFGGRLVARLYERSDGRVTVDLTPARQAHTDEACGYEMPAGLKALDAKYGGGAFRVHVSVAVARDTVLSYARMEAEVAAAI